MPLKVAALVLPLALDTFAVAAALGIAGMTPRERLRLSLVFAAFEAGMPLLGFAAGALLGSVLGGAADYLAVAVLIGVGVLILREDHELDAGALMRRTRGAAIIGLGLSVSLDELAVGFSIGLLRLPVLLVALLIGAQAFVATQLGAAFGGRLGERLRERAETVAGLALIGLGVLLLALKLTGRG
ncbi:MAG TPA: manganese efflux pump [Candidatus Dormibacteraeota bacterium]